MKKIILIILGIVLVSAILLLNLIAALSGPNGMTAFELVISWIIT